MDLNEFKTLIAEQSTIGRDYFKGDAYFSPGVKYLIYSPGIDRFLLIDTMDLWTTLETAKMLSSKIPVSIIALTNCSAPITMKNCLLWTISEKTGYKQTENQAPLIGSVSGEDQVEELGLALDYKDDISAPYIIKLQNYALFCQKILYAIKIADAETNSDDAEYYKELFEVDIRKLLQVRADHTRVPQGVLLWTKRILYMSNDIDEAMEKLQRLWNPNVARDTDIRSAFFKYAEIPYNEGLK